MRAKAGSSRRLAEHRRRLLVRRLIVDAMTLMRHKTGAQKTPHHLQKAETHQIRAERNTHVNDPARPFELRRHLIGVEIVDIDGAERADYAGEQRAAQ